MPWPLRRTSSTVSPRVIFANVYLEVHSLPLPGYVALDNVSNEVEHILKEIAYKDERMAGELLTCLLRITLPIGLIPLIL